MVKKKLGIIEAYYGRPWPALVRKSILERSKTWGFNSYIYGPKDDPFHRERWREPYPPKEFESIKDLASFLESLDMVFTFSISPGKDLQYSGNRDLSYLVKKFYRFYQEGIKSFGIFFDDIPPFLSDPVDLGTFSSLAEAQNHFLLRFYEELKKIDSEIELISCPTEYHGNGTSEYIKQFCRDLPDELLVFWTGREVCSQSLSTPDSIHFKKHTGHDPLYWDNYPVNDSVMRNELHLGPYKNRDSDIFDHSNGIVLNVMEYPYSSQISLYTAADFYRNRGRYDPMKSWTNALDELISPQIRDAYEEFAQYNFRSCIYPHFSNPILLKDFWDKVNIPGWNCGKALKDVAEKGSSALKILKQFEDNPFVQEAHPWIKQYENLLEVFSAYEDRFQLNDAYNSALEKLRTNKCVLFQMDALASVDKDYFLQ